MFLLSIYNNNAYIKIQLVFSCFVSILLLLQQKNIKEVRYLCESVCACNYLIIIQGRNIYILIKD